VEKKIYPLVIFFKTIRIILCRWFYLLGSVPFKNQAKFNRKTGMFKLRAGATEIGFSAGESRTLLGVGFVRTSRFFELR